MKNSKYRYVVNSISRTDKLRSFRVPLNVIVITLLILICLGMIYYFHWVRGIEIVFTHFFYLPIALAGFFWKRKGPVRDEKGEISQYVHIARDVTERVEAERALTY